MVEWLYKVELRKSFTKPSKNSNKFVVAHFCEGEWVAAGPVFFLGEDAGPPLHCYAGIVRLLKANEVKRVCPKSRPFLLSSRIATAATTYPYQTTITNRHQLFGEIPVPYVLIKPQMITCQTCNKPILARRKTRKFCGPCCALVAQRKELRELKAQVKGWASQTQIVTITVT